MGLFNAELSDNSEFLDEILNGTPVHPYYAETEEGTLELECAYQKALAQYNEELMLNDEGNLDETGAYDFRRGFRYGIGWLIAELRKTSAPH
jgi:hypothetical protein